MARKVKIKMKLERGKVKVKLKSPDAFLPLKNDDLTRIFGTTAVSALAAPDTPAVAALLAANQRKDRSES